ncbi:MAG: hypothetical protein ACR2QO_06705 [Acidimicrobiales bacterium]
MWWVVGVVAFLVMLYSCALPGDLAVGRDSGSDGLAGTYAVNGVDPSGVEYSGTVIIRDGEVSDTVTIEWIVTGAVHEGSGVVRGDQLDVEWQTVSSGSGGGEGTAVYRIEGDGSLVGTRLIDGVAEPATEEIFPEP